MRMPRPARLVKPLATAIVFLLVVSSATVVFAAGQFDDVPADNPFYADITALVGAGVTGGCGDGSNYCPGNPVTRQQMAGFLHRGLGRAAYGATPGFGATPIDITGTSEATATTLATITLTTPGLAGNTVMVKLDGAGRIALKTGGGPDCTPCSYVTRIFDGDDPVSLPSEVAITQSVVQGNTANTVVVEAPTGVAKTYSVRAYRVSGANSSTFHGDASITAITASFGADGGNTLNAPM